jgi:hypothetical protein
VVQRRFAQLGAPLREARDQGINKIEETRMRLSLWPERTEAETRKKLTLTGLRSRRCCFFF